MATDATSNPNVFTPQISLFDYNRRPQGFLVKPLYQKLLPLPEIEEVETSLKPWWFKYSSANLRPINADDLDMEAYYVQ